MADEGGVAGRPYDEIRRFGIAPSLAFGIGHPHPPHRQLLPPHRKTTLPTTVCPGSKTVSLTASTGMLTSAFRAPTICKTNDDILTLKANHTFEGSGEVDLHTIARWANYPRDVQITEPQICSNVSVSTPVGGYVASLPTSALNSALTCAYTQSTPAVADRRQSQPDSDQERRRRFVGPDRSHLPDSKPSAFAMTSQAVSKEVARSPIPSRPATQRTGSTASHPLTWPSPLPLTSSPVKAMFRRSPTLLRRASACTSSTRSSSDVGSR